MIRSGRANAAMALAPTTRVPRPEEISVAIRTELRSSLFATEEEPSSAPPSAKAVRLSVERSHPDWKVSEKRVAKLLKKILKEYAKDKENYSSVGLHEDDNVSVVSSTVSSSVVSCAITPPRRKKSALNKAGHMSRSLRKLISPGRSFKKDKDKNGGGGIPSRDKGNVDKRKHGIEASGGTIDLAPSASHSASAEDGGKEEGIGTKVQAPEDKEERAPAEPVGMKKALPLPPPHPSSSPSPPSMATETETGPGPGTNLGEPERPHVREKLQTEKAEKEEEEERSEEDKKNKREVPPTDAIILDTTSTSVNDEGRGVPPQALGSKQKVMSSAPQVKLLQKEEEEEEGKKGNCIVVEASKPRERIHETETDSDSEEVKERESCSLDQEAAMKERGLPGLAYADDLYEEGEENSKEANGGEGGCCEGSGCVVM